MEQGKRWRLLQNLTYCYKEIELNVALTGTDKLSEEIKNKVGSRPVINLNLGANGNKIEFNNPEAAVKVTIPYNPTAEELKNPEHIVVWYIDDKGNVKAVPSGKYDPATQSVTFKTTHFSHYAISYVVKSFGDTAAYGWAKREIEVLASKGIIEGTSATTFHPSANITRADYVTLIVKTLGLNAKVDTNFSDVKATDYYYEAVGIAKQLGIVNGTGENVFNPKEHITRQDMFTLTARALKAVKLLKEQGTAQDLAKFTDKGAIASYAVDSLATLVKDGLLEGDGMKVNPLSNATRAETAVLMYRIYNK